MKQIRVNKLICVILIVVAIFSSYIITKKIYKNITIKERVKHGKRLISTYKDIIYAFSKNKEKNLLFASLSIINSEIESINYNNNNINRYDYLCPILNKKIKKLLIEAIDKKQSEYIDRNITHNFNKEKVDFKKGYNKILNYCNKNKD